MQLKEYQTQCLQTLREYLASVKDAEATDPHYAAMEAWRATGRINYNRLKDYPDSRPFICIQVPTGGGKTLLAAHAVDMAKEYLTRRKTGLVLWVVPTQQIYKQTLKALQTRDHPYRQVLDRASAGRTMIIEKDDRFTPSDIEGNLVVLMLMIQSGKRQSKDFLRMYRDSEFTQFFPSEERLDLHAKMLEQYPMLDTHTDFDQKQIKTSLGNTIRILEPIVILDEGHKATSQLSQQMLAAYNPRAIIEFTATPHPLSNIVEKITGKQLLDEKMVKLPLHVRNVENSEWQDTLSDAITRLNELNEAAKKYGSASGKYIRPICLIQVERIGKDQRDRGYIHAEEVKEELLKRKGVYANEIAIQSSEKKELTEFEDANGLLTKENHIRFIITKEALKEGWDCSFAYVLCLLNTPGTKTGATQLIGRILRQPYAEKTGVPLLDEAYVVSHRQNNVVNDIKKGFDDEGLIGLGNQIRLDGTRESNQPTGTPISRGIRDEFKKSLKHFILPTFVYAKNGNARALDYEADILSRLDWESLDIKQFIAGFRFEGDKLHNTNEAVSVGDDDEFTSISHRGEIVNTYYEVTPEYIASEILNVIPNPWMAYELSERALTLLQEKEKDEAKLRHNLYHLTESFRTWLRDRKDELARIVFFDLMEKDEIRFVFFTDSWRPPTQMTVSSEDTLISIRHPEKGVVGVQKSLFEPEVIVAEDYNKSEKEVALWLDKYEQLFFWMRNYSTKGNYFLQGWKPNKLYPDFISTTRMPDGSFGIDRVFVIESKGMHLVGNEKTKYLEEIFAQCNKAQPKHISELGFEMNTKPIKYEVLHLHDWQNKLQALFED
jgi:type III restriction enzyme